MSRLLPPKYCPHAKAFAIGRALFVVVTMTPAGSVLAKDGPPAVAKPTPSQSATSKQALPKPTPAPAPVMPDPTTITMLIRTTLIALSQANQTGNYSVLRDLATPQFQVVNSDARLTEIFAGIRNRHLNLSPILLLEPKLVRAPEILDSGLLRITGLFDTLPERVLFDMAFENIAGQWRLAAILVDLNSPAPASAPTPPAAVQSEKHPATTPAQKKASSASKP